MVHDTGSFAISQEHSGNDPNAKLVPTTLPGMGWTKPTETTHAATQSVPSCTPAGLHEPPAIGPTVLADGLPSSPATGTATSGNGDGHAPARKSGVSGAYGVSRVPAHAGMVDGLGKGTGPSMGHSMLQEQEFPSLQATIKQGSKCSAEVDPTSKERAVRTIGSNWEEDERAFRGRRGPNSSFHQKARQHNDGFPIPEGPFNSASQRDDFLHPRRFHKDSSPPKGGLRGLSTQDVRAQNGLLESQSALYEEGHRFSRGRGSQNSMSPPRRFYRDTPEVEEEKACQDLVNEDAEASLTGRYSDPSLDQAFHGESQRSPRFTPIERTFHEDPRTFRRDVSDRFSRQRSPIKRERMVEDNSPFTPDMPPPRILQRPQQATKEEELKHEKTGNSDVESQPVHFQSSHVDAPPQPQSTAMQDGASISSSSEAALGPLFNMRGLIPPSSNRVSQESSIASSMLSTLPAKVTNPTKLPSGGRPSYGESTPHLHRREMDTTNVLGATTARESSTKGKAVTRQSDLETVAKSGGTEQRRRRGGRRVREAEAVRLEQGAAEARQLGDSGGEGLSIAVASDRRSGRDKAQNKSQTQPVPRTGSEKGRLGEKAKRNGMHVPKNVEKKNAKGEAQPLSSHDFLDSNASLNRQQTPLSGFGSLSAANKGSTNSLTGIPTYGADWTAGTTFGTSLSSIGGFTDAFAPTGREPDWKHFSDTVDSGSFGVVRTTTEAALYASTQERLDSRSGGETNPPARNSRHIAAGSEDGVGGRESSEVDNSKYASSDVQAPSKPRRNTSNRGRGSRGGRQGRRRPTEVNAGKRHTKGAGPAANEPHSGS